jgi:hypothetical protein
MSQTMSNANTRDQQPRTKEAAHMSDENERSVASDGSVGEPLAWAALREDGDVAWIGYTPEGAADGACGRQIVPLYRQPHATVRLPREPEDFEISEANGYAAAIADVKRALAEAGIEWTE